MWDLYARVGSRKRSESPCARYGSNDGRFSLLCGLDGGKARASAPTLSSAAQTAIRATTELRCLKRDLKEVLSCACLMVWQGKQRYFSCIL